jgi:two-component sensor histidine kinase/methanogenic corrinoid protein MtbC1
MTASIGKAPFPDFDGASSGLSPLARAYLSALLDGDRGAAARWILGAVEGGVSVKSIYLDVLQPVQYRVGELWQTGVISVAKEHYCTAMTQLVMAQLYPKIFSTKRTGRKLVAACVGGELHELGIRMVADFFEMEGWDTYFLGANVPSASIEQAVREEDADLVALSVSMAFHLDSVAKLIGELRANDSSREVKILVGGRQFNLRPELWRRVGADGFAPGAEEALLVAERLLLPGQAAGADAAATQARVPASVETLQLLKSLGPNLIAETASAWTDRMRGSGVTEDRIEARMSSGAEFLVSTLESAMAVGDLGLLADQAAWTKSNLESQGIGPGMLSANLVDCRDVVLKRLPRQNAVEVLTYIDALTEMLDRDMGPEIPRDISPDNINLDDRIFNEVSRANNEVMNAQRQVAKQNAKLERLNDELAKEIVERKRIASELESALSMNKDLLRELQHRAINTFNMILGLVSFTLSETDNSETRTKFEEFEAKVRSISRLYSFLYSKSSFSKVRLDEYCSEVVAAMSSFAPRVTFVGLLDEVTVEPEIAAPIGLMLTELLTNSLKYAFPITRSGRVEVSLKSMDGMAMLEVRDDGAGIPVGFDPSAQSGMGLKLIQGLASQIGGSYSMTSLDCGTSSRITFPLAKDTERTSPIP